MPKLEQRPNRGALPSPGGAGTGLRAVPNLDTGAGGRAISGALDSFSNQLIQNAAQDRLDRENLETRDSLVGYKQRVLEFYQEEQQKTGADTFDNIDRYEKFRAIERQKFLNGKSKRVRDELSLRMDDVDLNMNSNLFGIYQQGKLQYSKTVEDREMNTSKLAVGLSPTRQTFNAELANIASWINEEAPRRGLDAEATQALKEAKAAELAYHLISSVAATDPMKAVEIIDNHSFDKFFTGKDGPEQLKQLLKFATDQQELFDKNAIALRKQNLLEEKRANEQAGEEIKNKWLTGFLTGKPPSILEIAQTDIRYVDADKQKEWVEYVSNPEHYNKNDLDYVNKEYALIDSGERKYEDIKAIPFKVSIAEMSKMRNYSNQQKDEKFKPVKAALTSALESGEKQILAGTSRYSVFKGAPAARIDAANKFKSDLRGLLEGRSPEEQAKMLNPRAPEYVVGDLIRVNSVSDAEVMAIQERQKSLETKRIVNNDGKESADSYLKRMQDIREAELVNISLKAYGITKEQNLTIRSFLRDSGIKGTLGKDDIIDTYNYLKKMGKL